MALLDPQADVFVVRIVYDGPPFSGKTTTLHSLSSSWGGHVDTPSAHDGRTLFFDWLDYTAGRFEGRPIRCQIVSVPGQKSLAQRRQRLLEDADSVVFVADTGRLGMELSLKYARELGSTLAKLEGPRPGVVVQANKRDVGDAMPLGEVTEAFRKVGIDAAVIETTATTGSGIREAFLFSVRLALDRVRELSRRQMLRTGKPEVDSSADLLGQLTAAQPVPPPKAAASEASSALDSTSKPAATTAASAPRVVARTSGHRARVAGSKPETPSTQDSRSLADLIGHAIRAEQISGPAPAGSPAERDEPIAWSLPDPDVSSECIWPPIEGRVITQQALAVGKPQLRPLPGGGVCADSSSGWSFQSRRENLFRDRAQGRAALIEWARLHARNREFISERRCILLSPTRSGWCLWQIFAHHHTLHDRLAAGLATRSAKDCAQYAMLVAKKLLAARDAFANATIKLELSLRTITADTPLPRYFGPMPQDEIDERIVSADTQNDAQLLASALANDWSLLVGRRGATEVREEIAKFARTPELAALAENLSAILAAERAAS